MNELLPLDEYPAAIAANDRKTAEIEQEVLAIQKRQAVVDADLQMEISQDPALTNDTKRKAALVDRRANGRYAELQREIDELVRQKGALAIERSRLLREFDVAKLQYERETVLIRSNILPA